MSSIDLVNTYTLMIGLTVLAAFGFVFLKEWRRSREYEYKIRQEELLLKQREVELSKNNKIMINNETTTSTADLGGYVTIEIPEERKSIFHDLLKGFEEYAAVKGYKVSVSIDSSELGRISFKIIILDFGITSTRKTVKEDLNEYVEKIRNGDPLDDLPEVLDHIEHSRIIMALKNRITFLQQNYQVERNIREFYQSFFDRLPLHSIDHASPVFNISNSGRSEVDQRKYIATNSANTMQGDHQSNLIESGDVRIGTTFSEKKDQLTKIEELIKELKGAKNSSQNQDAIRHLENVKEEIQDSEVPDKGMVGKWLNKANSALSLLDKGSTLYDKAKQVFDSFDIQM